MQNTSDPFMEDLDGSGFFDELDAPAQAKPRQAPARRNTRHETAEMLKDMRATKINRLMLKMQDKKWRMSSGFYMILDEKARTIPFSLREEQLQILNEHHTRNFIPKARKLGMSTFHVLDILDDCIFTPNFKGGVIDLKEDDAIKKLSMALFAWKQGPKHPDKDIAFLWQRLHTINPLTSDSKKLMAWKKGSEFSAGVRYTGQTPQRLLVSELGPVAARTPEVAKDILRGSMNAVTQDGRIDVETTMEGGRMGVCYKIFKSALDASGKDLDPLTYKLHFFSWLKHPSYKFPGRKPVLASTIEYFAELQRKYTPYLESLGYRNGKIPDERQAWWESKRKDQGELMWQQYPSVIDEVDRNVVAGQIYPEMTSLRAYKRVMPFSPERALPLYIACDLGASDNSAAWLIQPAGKFHNVLRCAFGEGKGAAGIADLYRAWSAEFPQHRIEQILLPHDANITDKGAGATYKSALIRAGIHQRNIAVVPRTPDVWVGIELVRDLLPNTWIHTACDEKQRDEEGGDLPSGVERLEAYRKQPDTASGVVRNNPVGDICSHAADAFRTYAEARHHGLIRSTQRAGGAYRSAGDDMSGFALTDDSQPVKVVMYE